MKYRSMKTHNVLNKLGELTKTAKIKIFHIYVKSKINHLIPMIALRGGTMEDSKKIYIYIFTGI